MSTTYNMTSTVSIYSSLKSPLGDRLERFTFPISLEDDGFDMPSDIYDSLRPIQCVSVVFISVKTSSTHYQAAGFLTKWLVVLHFYPQTIKLNGSLSIFQKIKKYMKFSLVMFTVYPNKVTFWLIEAEIGPLLLDDEQVHLKGKVTQLYCYPG